MTEQELKKIANNMIAEMEAKRMKFENALLDYIRCFTTDDDIVNDFRNVIGRELHLKLRDYLKKN